MADPPAELRGIFCDALDRKTAQERAEYLDQACRGRPELRSRVEALLRAEGEASDFLQEPSGPRVAGPELIREGPGTILGPYKLLEEIGEGGFGLVFMAEQQQPLRRKVAVKILKPGMDTRQVTTRFEAERHALALMDHANIAKVLDAGETSSGRPYFVMELCRGVPITDYCDQNGLPPRARLELFVSVCKAVQHAHLKGLIHRDIKPSNVLVTLHDGAPVVKMIDFGIAKALGHQLTDKTLFTGFAQLLGTPLYMSPEQAELSGLDIDTRSDIYSLGVLLYELLTGMTPFDKERLSEAGYDEMRRIIREEEPPRPSTRLSTVGRAATTVSARRQSDPKRLSRLFRGELDWIVMKALEKDRNRRYETASAFAADVECYLRDEPVAACPPSITYRVRKLARRHKGAFRIAVVATLLLLFAAGAAGWVVGDQKARRAATEELVDDTLKHADEQVQQRQWPEAQAAAKRAEGLLAADGGNPKQHQRLRQLLTDLELVARLEEIRLQCSGVKDNHYDNTQADPEYARAFREYGIDVDRLEAGEAAERMRQRSIRVDLAVAVDDWSFTRQTTRPRVGKSWKQLLAVARLADPDPWRNRLRDALENNDGKTLQKLADSAAVATLPPVVLVHLGTSLLRRPDTVPQAVALLRRAQEHHPGSFWINHALFGALKAMNPPQVDEAFRFITVAAALRPQSPGVQVNLGRALLDRGRYDESIAASRRAIHLLPTFALAHSNLAIALEAKGERDAALAAGREAIRLKPDFALAHNNLGIVLQARKLVDEAIAAHREAIRLQPTFAEAHYNLGITLRMQGQVDPAIAAYREAIRLKPGFAQAHDALGVAFGKKGLTDEAIAAHRKSVRIQPDYAVGHYNLGIALRSKGQLDAAIAAYREAIRFQPNMVSAHFNLGVALQSKGQVEAAVHAFKEVIRLKPDHEKAYVSLGNALSGNRQLDAAIAAFKDATRVQPDNVVAHNNLGVTLMRTGQIDAAIAAYQEAIRHKPNFAMAHYNLGNALEGKAKQGEAIAAYQKAIQFNPEYAEAHCNLGQALVKQGRFAEALTALRRGHMLGSRNKYWNNRSAPWVQRCERLLALDGLLPTVLKGDVQPAAAEGLEFASLCTLKRLHCAAAKFYKDAFAAQPELAMDLKTEHRYRAACAAALAAAGEGNEAPPRDPQALVRWRLQALAWLRADLGAWAKHLQNATPQARADAQRALQSWQKNPALASLRDPGPLARLPEADQEACLRLWTEVNALLKQAQAKSQR